MYTEDLNNLRAAAKDPIRTCECCGGNTKLYRRKLNSGMARTLMWLVKERQGVWTCADDMPAPIKRYATELGKLLHWGFVSVRQNPEGEIYGKTNQWMPTELGVNFIEGFYKAPSHIFLQSPSNRVYGFEDKRVTAKETLGEHFNYQELMEGS